MKGEVLTAGLFGRARNDLLLWGEDNPSSPSSIQDLRQQQQQTPEVEVLSSGGTAVAAGLGVQGEGGLHMGYASSCPAVGSEAAGSSGSSSVLPRPGAPTIATAALGGVINGKGGINDGREEVDAAVAVAELSMGSGDSGKGQQWKVEGLTAVQRVLLLGKELRHRL